jgi:excisionase family DNA binding protein
VSRRPSDVLTVDEAAGRLKVDRKSLYATIARGEFWPAVRIGRRLVIPRAAFEAWLRDPRAPRSESVAGVSEPVLSGARATPTDPPLRAA